MGLINLEPRLGDGEQEAWRRPAMWCLDRSTLAGTLHLTSSALIFVPNRLNLRRHLEQTRIDLTDVTAITVAPPQRTLANRRNGAMRPRLRIATSTGESHLVVVNHPDQVAAELQPLLATPS